MKTTPTLPPLSASQISRLPNASDRVFAIVRREGHVTAGRNSTDGWSFNIPFLVLNNMVKAGFLVAVDRPGMRTLYRLPPETPSVPPTSAPVATATDTSLAALQGAWKGVDVSSEDIDELRRTTWWSTGVRDAG